MLWLTVACSGPSTPPPPPPEPVPEPAPESAPPPPRAPEGPAWLAVQGAGIVRWDGAGPRLVGALAEVDDTALAGDTLWVVGDHALWRLDGETWAQVVELPEPVAASGVAVGPDGRVWVAGFQQLHVWDGTALTTHHPPFEPLADVAVGPDGEVWLAGQGRVAHGRPPAALVEVPPVEGATFLADLVVTDVPTVAALGEGQGPVTLRDGRWIHGVGGFSSEGEALVLGPGGALVTVAGQEAHVGDRAVTGLPGYFPTAVAADAADRTWVASDLGLAVIERDGAVRSFTPGTLPALDGTITRIRVAAGGPPLAAAPPPVKGTVRGRVLLPDGTPFAGADLLLCDDASLTYTKDPCEGGTVRLAGGTDQDGRFEVAEVPLGLHQLLLRNVPNASAEWTIVLGTACCRRMRPQETLDLGDIALVASTVR